MILTRRQREIWEYLNAYTDSHGYAPTLEEIGAHFGLSSLATVHKHLSNLERKGVIARKWNLSRAIELTPPQETAQALELPLLGQVAAGVPIEAVETRDVSGRSGRPGPAAPRSLRPAGHRPLDD